NGLASKRQPAKSWASPGVEKASSPTQRRQFVCPGTSMPDQPAIEAAKALLDVCKRKKLTRQTANPCPGVLFPATKSKPPGSSAFFARAFFTYPNDAKQKR